MEIKELIRLANIRLANVDRQDMLKLRTDTITDAQLSEIKTRKPEIVAELKNLEAAEKEREEKIKSIEGLGEIKRAVADMEFYHEQYESNFENENGCCNPIHKPEVSIDGLRKKYPRAAAYIHAESFTFSMNPDKFAAGKKAIEKIIDGGDYDQAITDMEKEWAEAAEKSVMNS